MMLMTLIIGLMAGPAVSLLGSPTVSPVTEALCASEPFPPSWPSSMYFLALSQAAPPLVICRARKSPVMMAPSSIPPSARAEDEAHCQRGQHRDDAWQDHLALRRRRDDAHGRPVLGLGGAFHDSLDLAELAAHLLHDQAARAADRQHGQ